MTATDQRSRREQLVIEHMESENVQQWDRTMATFSHPRYELVPSGKIIDGEHDVLAYWHRGRATFPDQRNELIRMHHADNNVIVEFWLRGTQSGGPSPSGKSFECQMCAIFEFDDADLMTSERVYFDRRTIEEQLSASTDRGEDP